VTNAKRTPDTTKFRIVNAVESQLMSQESKDYERYRSALRKAGIIFVPGPNDILEHIHPIIPHLKEPFP
jgi:hypothetical protein